MSELCKYLGAPAEAEALTPAGWQPMPTVRSLCGWAQFHPAAVAALSTVPPFVQRVALGGHEVRPEQDCRQCQYFAAGPPIE